MMLAACESSFFSTPFQFVGLLWVLLLWFLIGLVIAWLVFERKRLIASLLGQQRTSRQRLLELSNGGLAALPAIASVAPAKKKKAKSVADTSISASDSVAPHAAGEAAVADSTTIEVPPEASKLGLKASDDAPAADPLPEVASPAVAAVPSLADFDSKPRSAGEYEALTARNFVDEDVTINPDLGVLYNGQPGKADDLQLIRGVGSVLEGRLHASGVYRFKQLAAWDQHNINAFSQNLNTFPDRIERDEWVPQARELADMAAKEDSDVYVAPTLVDHKGKLQSEFRGEPVRADVNLGVVYERPPEVQDELQSIEGVDAETEEALNDFGVYRYRQIANWSDHNVTEFADKLERSKDRIERDKWIPQARRLHGKRYMSASRWESSSPSADEYAALGKELYPNDEVRADETLGLLFASKPAAKDDLTALPGVNSDMQKQLNDLGIYRSGQIANWSDANVQALSAKLGVSEDTLLAWSRRADRGLPALPEEMKPDPVAKAALEAELEGLAADLETLTDVADDSDDLVVDVDTQFKGEDVRVDEKLGVLYTKAPSVKDDLTKIKGIGKVINGKLNKYGVYRFKQIALWSRRQADDFATELGTFQDRVHRDKWIAQARTMHQDKHGDL